MFGHLYDESVLAMSEITYSLLKSCTFAVFLFNFYFYYPFFFLMFLARDFVRSPLRCPRLAPPPPHVTATAPPARPGVAFPISNVCIIQIEFLSVFL